VERGELEWRILYWNLFVSWYLGSLYTSFPVHEFYYQKDHYFYILLLSLLLSFPLISILKQSSFLRFLTVYKGKMSEWYPRDGAHPIMIHFSFIIITSGRRWAPYRDENRINVVRLGWKTIITSRNWTFIILFSSISSLRFSFLGYVSSDWGSSRPPPCHWGQPIPTQPTYHFPLVMVIRARSQL